MLASHSNDTLTNLVKLADPGLAVKDEVALYNTTLMYLFRGLNYKAFSARLAKLSGTTVNARSITESLSQNGQVIRNLKVWVFYVVKNRCDHKTSLALARQWGIALCDVKAFAKVNRTTLAHLRRLAKKYKALTLEKLDASVVHIVQSTRTWLGKFVSRKLRFVIQSQGLHRHDVEHELVYKGIQGLYVMYPCVDTLLHATNVVKRVIHNQGINMIHHYTTQKMGRLLQDQKGAFSARVVGLDEAHLNVIAAPEQRSDLAVDLTRMLPTFKPKQQRFVELLCGAYCSGFTKWLTEQGYKLETNEELLDRLKIKQYVELALRYLDVPVDAGMRFIERLREVLSPYSIEANKTGVIA